jgi:DNA-directed RNA polymerase specialized sigma24 family protein
VRRASLVQRGATFLPRRPVRAVTLADRYAPDPAQATAGHLLADYGREGGRGRALRAQMAERFPRRPEEDIEDAVQTACRCFLDEADGITEPGSAYAWIRTAAYRAMLRELRSQSGRVSFHANGGEAGGTVVDDGPGPVEELIDLEDTADMEVLVREVASSLSDQRRQILAFWAAGRKKPEIASELGLSERAVKRGLEDVMRQAREVLAGRTGGGCHEGESLVLRFACGLAGAGEAIRARAHLERCGSCSAFSEQLETWREKAGVMLGPAAIEVAHPGVVGRVVGRAADTISSVKRSVMGGAAQVKQQAAAGYARTPDPTPLAGVRPGAVAAVVAGCLAIGTGATYCAQQGVDPLAAATGLISGTQEEGGEEPAPPPAKEPQAPVVPSEQSAEGPVTETTYEPPEEAPPTGEEAHPAEKESPSISSASEPEPEPEPEPEEVTPPPEASFEPSSPDYTATESSASETSSSPSSSGSETAGSEASRAVAVPADEAPQFGGP